MSVCLSKSCMLGSRRRELSDLRRIYKYIYILSIHISLSRLIALYIYILIYICIYKCICVQEAVPTKSQCNTVVVTLIILSILVITTAMRLMLIFK